LALEGSVPGATRVRRASLLRELSSQRHLERAETQVGSEKKGLVLSETSKLITRDYWQVRLLEDSSRLQPGVEVKVKMVRFVPAAKGRMDGWFEGKVVN
jgi:tRNA A37 methylthiotransferase MiaB